MAFLLKMSPLIVSALARGLARGFMKLLMYQTCEMPFAPDLEKLCISYIKFSLPQN